MPSLTLLNQGRSCLLPNRPRHPVVLTHGEDCYVWDDQGRRYLDFASGATGNLLGHGHPRLARVLSDHGRSLLAAPARCYHRTQVELASLLTDLSFADRALFCRDAPEARAAAAALVGQYRAERNEPQRDQILVALPPGWEEPVRTSVPGAAIEAVPYGLSRDVAAALSRRTSAVIAAPIVLAGGIVTPEKGYLSALAHICREEGLLFCVDETRVPLGRSGSLFASEPDGVRPDLHLLGHSLAVSDPFGVVLLREDLARGAGRSLAGFSVGGAPLVCAVALETLRALKEDRLLDSCQRVGRYLGNQLAALKARFDLIEEAGGLGLMRTLRFSVPCEPIALACQERGLQLAQGGSHTLLFMPPLTAQRAHARAALTVLRSVLAGETVDEADDRTPDDE